MTEVERSEPTCPRCGAKGNEHCATASGRDHPSRIKAELAHDDALAAAGQSPETRSRLGPQGRQSGGEAVTPTPSIPGNPHAHR
jgi:hypothetical protein